MSTSPIDWSKPIEYNSLNSYWVPLTILCQNSEVVFTQYTINGANYYATWRKALGTPCVRNVPPPKKKVWEVTFRKTQVTHKLYEHDPQAHIGISGKRFGMDGWEVYNTKEIEV